MLSTNKNEVFTIGEIGINHNGDINIAKKLILEAKLGGFKSVKFQKRTIEYVYSKEELDALRESPWGTTNREQKEGLEFSESEFDQINEYCNEKEILWSASAWDIKSLEFLDNYKLKFHKIASPMIIDKDFLEEVASRKIYTFISTGMSNREDIDYAVKIFRKNNCPFELMHCVSIYPLDPEKVNLSTIEELKKTYDCKVGYSGHENGIAISIAAVAIGATSIERHITLDRTMYGSDQSASLEPVGFRNLIGSIKKIELAFGSPKVGVIDEKEIPIANKLRSHIYRNM